MNERHDRGEVARAKQRQDEAARRRRRAAVFGEVLPEATRDDRVDGDERPAESSDEWLRAQVPPHHG